MRVTEIVGRFVGHVVVGAVQFLVVAFVAAAVGILTQWIGHWSEDQILATGLMFTKYLIVLADIVLLLGQIWYALLHALKEIRHAYRKADLRGNP